MARGLARVATTTLLIAGGSSLLAPGCSDDVESQDPKDGISCSVNGNSCECLLAAENETTCDESIGDNTICCAQPDWPKSGSCTCSVVSCSQYDTLCNCGVGGVSADAELVPSCKARGGGVCCQLEDTCSCYDDLTACTGTLVEECAAALIEPQCPTSQVTVTGCRADPGSSSGPGSAPSTGSGADCPGSGYVSCSDSTECSCGLFCSTITSNSTDKYCTASCSADSDCSSSSQWTFSSVGCNPLTFVCTP